ncbi:MAG: biotin/lipoate A/B protein ligase family protein [Anaerolineales bacterium]
MNEFRLLVQKPAAGDWNMAADEAILESIGLKESPPTIRLYAWEPPCLSLGYAQSIGDVDKSALADCGWGLVRRMTGGRAILHADELTYSVIAPYEEPLVSGTLLEGYNRIAGGLLKTMKLLGVTGEINEKNINPAANQPGPVCFEVPSAFEITVGGKKVIGSAQARRKQGVLQHGSLPLYGDLGRIINVLHFSNDETRSESLRKLLEHAANLEMITGSRLDWQTAANAFIDGFQSALDLMLIYGDLSSREEERILVLMHEKYSHLDWTERV